VTITDVSRNFEVASSGHERAEIGAGQRAALLQGRCQALDRRPVLTHQRTWRPN